MSATTVHFWEVLDPHPAFLCGKEPVQGRRDVAPALRVTLKTVRWFGAHPQACANCLRVARARIAPKKRKPPVFREVCWDGGGRCTPRSCEISEGCTGPVPNPLHPKYAPAHPGEER
jgi:hypothetical protein